MPLFFSIIFLFYFLSVKDQFGIHDLKFAYFLTAMLLAKYPQIQNHNIHEDP